MRDVVCLLLLACGCGGPPPRRSALEKPASQAPRITQFYASPARVEKGQKTLLCYGVEGADSALLEPGGQALSPALSRCIEVKPAETTRYTLTASGPAGAAVNGTVTVQVGPTRARIVNVTVSALEVRAGDLVSICYETQSAESVAIAPIGFRGAGPQGCATDQPSRTTTYTVRAAGSGGSDSQSVTVRVQPRNTVK